MPPRPNQRHLVVIAFVLAGHLLVLWGVHKASLGRPIAIVIPATLLAEFITPTPSTANPAPDAVPQPTPAPAPPPRSQPATPTLAVADAALTALAPVKPSPRAAPPAPEANKIVPPMPQNEATIAAPQVPEVVVKSSSQASDSLNPAPPYPATSRHLREAGRVVLRVLVAPDGVPQDVVLQRSSGFDRLDQISLETVRAWRIDPKLFSGNGQTQWVYVPINFVLE